MTDTPGHPMNIREILDCLPHRYPFLLVDRIDEVVPMETARGSKLLTINEEFFQGHFPDDPQMPVGLLIESMAQVGCTVVMSTPQGRGKNILFAAVDNCQFGRPARPGDHLDIRARMTNFRGDKGKIAVSCQVGEEILVSAEMMFALTDPAA
ncbi:MAG: 3-hydroxyacyl-[acyl-carrier-protein] dehydratase FabZ [Candidatus Xenobia bacterium]|jgi:beta-hydroxyacyl-ACP dehydratase FabZ